MNSERVKAYFRAAGITLLLELRVACATTQTRAILQIGIISLRGSRRSAQVSSVGGLSRVGRREGERWETERGRRSRSPGRWTISVDFRRLVCISLLRLLILRRGIALPFFLPSRLAHLLRAAGAKNRETQRRRESANRPIAHQVGSEPDPATSSLSSPPRHPFSRAFFFPRPAPRCYR